MDGTKAGRYESSESFQHNGKETIKDRSGTWQKSGYGTWQKLSPEEVERVDAERDNAPNQANDSRAIPPQQPERQNGMDDVTRGSISGAIGGYAGKVASDIAREVYPKIGPWRRGIFSSVLGYGAQQAAERALRKKTAE